MKLQKVSRLLILGNNIKAYKLAIFFSNLNIDVTLINSGKNFSNLKKLNIFIEEKSYLENLIDLEKKALFNGVKIFYDSIDKITYINNCFNLFGYNFVYKVNCLILSIENTKNNLSHSYYIDNLNQSILDMLYFKKKYIALFGEFFDLLSYLNYAIEFKINTYIVTICDLNSNIIFFKHIFDNIYNVNFFNNYILYDVKKFYNKYDITIKNIKNNKSTKFKVNKYYFIGNKKFYNEKKYLSFDISSCKYLNEKNGFFILYNKHNYFYEDKFNYFSFILKINNFLKENI